MIPFEELTWMKQKEVQDEVRATRPHAGRRPTPGNRHTGALVSDLLLLERAANASIWRLVHSHHAAGHDAGNQAA